MTKIMARPATPPTMPPTRSCVGGAPLLPELPFEVDEGGGVGAVLPELPEMPFPPAPTTPALDITDDDDAWFENCDDADADADTDVASVAGVDVVRSELVTEARFWDTLGLVAPEMEAIIAEMLAIEDCDAIGSARRKEDAVLDSEL